MGKGLIITGFVLSLLFFIPFVPLIGLVLGIIGLVKANKEKNAKKGLAIAAIVLGAIFTLFQIVLVTILPILFVGLFMKSNIEDSMADAENAIDCLDLDLQILPVKSGATSIRVQRGAGSDASIVLSDIRVYYEGYAQEVPQLCPTISPTGNLPAGTTKDISFTGCTLNSGGIIEIVPVLANSYECESQIAIVLSA